MRMQSIITEKKSNFLIITLSPSTLQAQRQYVVLFDQLAYLKSLEENNAATLVVLAQYKMNSRLNMQQFSLAANKFLMNKIEYVWLCVFLSLPRDKDTTLTQMQFKVKNAVFLFRDILPYFAQFFFQIGVETLNVFFTQKGSLGRELVYNSHRFGLLFQLCYWSKIYRDLVGCKTLRLDTY